MLEWKNNKKMESVKEKEEEQLVQDQKEQRRKNRKEMERQAKVIDNIVSNVLSKQLVKEKILGLSLSDVDDCEREGQEYVGLLGGVVGVIFQTFLNLKNVYGQLEEVNQEELLNEVVVHVLELVQTEGGSVVMSVSSAILRPLADLSLTLDSLSLLSADSTLKSKLLSLFL